ncbi:hypothetical protein GQX74_003586 [Glossina fuscipes]|nr:hypothetical protein GQX74_003586 [Glossina fuscipes]
MYLPESSESPVEMRGPAESGPLSVYTLPVHTSSEDCDDNKNYFYSFYHRSCNANTLQCKNIIHLSFSMLITITWAGLKSPLISGQQVQVQLTDTAILVPTTTTTITTIDKQMAAKCCKSPLAQAMPSFLTSCSFQTLFKIQRL